MPDLSNIDGTVDLFCVEDFRPEMPTVSGRVALAHRLARRLQTPRGRFIFWPNFGTDLRAFLLTKTPALVIASAAEAECSKDEQVQSVSVNAEVQLGGRQLHLVILVTDAAGPFQFTLTIDEAVATLILLQGASVA